MVDLEPHLAFQCCQSSHWFAIIVTIVVSFVVGAIFSIVLVDTRKVHLAIFRCHENLVALHCLLMMCYKIVEVVTTIGYKSRPSKDHYY